MHYVTIFLLGALLGVFIKTFMSVRSRMLSIDKELDEMKHNFIMSFWKWGR